ncbi:MAG: hypothetical protein M1820_005105 [Bogoriella megaspora]|nr:MAG: hypothetical protein M1820_005105 [Bogoriella megaspora]
MGNEKDEELAPSRHLGHKTSTDNPRELLYRTYSALTQDNSKYTDIELAQNEVEKQAHIAKESTSRTTTPAANPHGSKIVIDFEQNDPGNPHNWSLKKKISIMAVGILAVLNSTIGSSIAANAMPQMSRKFHIANEAALVLPTSLYLFGYVVGPLGWGPTSEAFGRYPILMSSFSGYVIWTMACALSPSWTAFNVFRFFAGVCASCPISVVGGLFADVFNDMVSRGRALSIFMASTCLGPVVGPIISGFIAPTSWRWVFWAALIIAGPSWIILLVTPETYGPVILRKRAQKVRKRTGSDVYAPIEMEATDWSELLTTVLARPFRMLFLEALVLFTCLFQAYIYGLFYMFFFAYPIIYHGKLTADPG